MSLVCLDTYHSQRIYLFKLGKSPRVIHQQLATVWGDKAVQYRSIARWCEKIRNNDFVSFADMEQIGRPVSKTTPENVDQILS